MLLSYRAGLILLHSCDTTTPGLVSARHTLAALVRRLYWISTSTGSGPRSMLSGGMTCYRYAKDPTDVKESEVDIVILTAQDVHCADLNYPSRLPFDPD